MINDYKLKEKSSPLSKIELIFFYFLFAAAIYAVYIKAGLALPFFLVILILAFFSKRNYFWIAFFFLILQAPAKFFYYTPNYHLPFLTFIPGLSLTPIDLFTVMMFAKFIINKKHIKFKLKTPFSILLVYFIFSFLLSGIFFNTSLDITGRFARSLAYLMWIFFSAAFMNEIEDIFKFFELILPIAFFILFSQVYYILNGGMNLISLFNPEVNQQALINTLTGEVRASLGGFPSLLCCYFGAFFLMQFKQNRKRKYYYNIITIMCFLSVLLSATRYAFGVFLFIALLIYSKKLKDLPKIIIFIVAIVLISMLLVKFGIFSDEYLKSSLWGRVSQVFDFASGKGGQIDTFASRLEQLRYMTESVKGSLFFGYGFSEQALQYSNNNWGFPNTIIMFGFFGFFMFIFLFKSYIKIISSTMKKPYIDPDIKAALKVLLATFSGMLLAYFTTWDFFSLFYPEVLAFDMIFFALSETLFKRANAEEKTIVSPREILA
jgi:hypothetical protein